MKKEKIKRFDFYPLIPFLFMLLVQLSVYFISKLVNVNMHHYVIKWGIDDSVPLWTFMSVIYFGCYVWWFLSPLIMGKYLSKKRFYQYLVATLLTHAVTLIFFIVLPTTISRPEIPSDNFFNWLTNFIYNSDVPDNLLPSMHSTVSWLCFIPFLHADKKKPPIWLILTQFTITILVFISTVTLKQHYIIDVVLAVIIVEIMFFISTKLTWYKFFERIFTDINIKLKIEK